MSIMEAVSSVFKHYASFSGRARRSEYWKFFLFNMIIYVVCYLASALFTGDSGQGSALPMGLLGIYGIATLIPGLAVAVRRLHDTGRSGGNLFILLIPAVGAILFLVWMCQDGDPGDNAYGHNPKKLFDARVEPAAAPAAAPAPAPVPVRRAEPTPAPAPKTRNCPFCGAVVAETAGFCTYCGSSLKAAAPVPRPAPVEKKPAEKSAVDDLWQTPTDF